MQNSMLLKIISILMIIGGAVSVLFSILSLSAGMTGSVTKTATGEDVVLLSILSLAIGCIQLAAGIAGLMNWKKPEHAGICITFGVVLVIISIANVIYSVIVSGISMRNVSSLIMGIILPALYLFSALQMRRK